MLPVKSIHVLLSVYHSSAYINKLKNQYFDFELTGIMQRDWFHSKLWANRLRTAVVELDVARLKQHRLQPED
jgi:hypothetical protein